MTNAEMFQDVFGRFPYLPCEDGYYIDAKLQDRQWWDMPFRDVQSMKWIPVTERLPERFETVIICGRMKYSFEKDYCRFVDVACFDKPYKEKCQDKWSIFNDWYEGQQEYEITHWMPLPGPPKEE